MAVIRTHYDNLKVARDAPQEVIRAAYRTLSKIFHPDRNPGDSRAARIMAVINASYDVLSDPKKRLAYDQLLAQQDLLATSRPPQSSNVESDARSASFQQRPLSRLASMEIIAHLGRYRVGFVIAACLAVSAALGNPTSPLSAKKPYTVVPPPGASRPAYMRPLTAPNGSTWPLTAAYVDGYERLNTTGLSSVVVDNSKNDADVFVKLVSLDGPDAYPVRTFFIPARSSFTVGDVTAGTYDVRYLELATGALARTESFDLRELTTDRGVEYSQLTMTLYKVHQGNMQTYSLSEAEF